MSSKPKSQASGTRRRGAFTLIELLVVIAIISILMAILLPTLKEAKRQAHINGCKNHEKQLYLGLSMYVLDSNDYRPRPVLWDLTTPQSQNTYNLTTDGPTDGATPVGLGLLYQHGYVRSGAVYYCPGASDFYGPYAYCFGPDINWDTGAKGWTYSNFAYRLNASGNVKPKWDQWKGQAIISDLAGVNAGNYGLLTSYLHGGIQANANNWNQLVYGYGMNTFYHDGHAEFVRVKTWMNNLFGVSSASNVLSNRWATYEFWTVADRRNGVW